MVVVATLMPMICRMIGLMCVFCASAQADPLAGLRLFYAPEEREPQSPLTEGLTPQALEDVASTEQASVPAVPKPTPRVRTGYATVRGSKGVQHIVDGVVLKGFN